MCIPNRSTKSAERKREQKKRWFKQGQKWRTGCEGRISVFKRRHGLRLLLAQTKNWHLEVTQNQLLRLPGATTIGQFAVFVAVRLCSVHIQNKTNFALESSYFPT